MTALIAGLVQVRDALSLIAFPSLVLLEAFAGPASTIYHADSIAPASGWNVLR